MRTRPPPFRSKSWLVTAAASLCAIVLWFGGCSSNGSGGPGKSGTSASTSGSGVCQSTCNKTCALDGDCDTSSGELCCDYGAAGKVCQSAQSCPKFCSSDSACQTASGQACEQVSLASPVMVCEPSQNGLKLCKADSDCLGTNQVCCTNYKEGVCLAANECPAPCTTSASCNTQQGEICCTSIGALDPSLAVKGLCLNPQYASCPTTCTTSSDCSAKGQLCCGGICQSTCPQTCQDSSDCTGQICCKTAGASLPPPPVVFSTGPTCTGTPIHTSCAQCGAGSSCGCAGCTSGSMIACNGTPYPCSDWTSDMAGCQATVGCTWADDAGVPCTGTAAACSTFTTPTSCANQDGCSATTSTSCAGTLTPCNQLGPTTCSTQPGCTLSFGGDAGSP